MTRHKTFALSIVLGLSLVACSSGGGNQQADCGTYQNSADTLLVARYELENTPLPTGLGSDSYRIAQFERIIDLKLKWADRVLQAPDGCFPDMDIYKAREYQAKYK
jgi:hypothetical protein